MLSDLWAVLNLREHFRFQRSMVAKTLGASCRGSTAELRALHLGLKGWVTGDGVKDTVGAQWPLVWALFGQRSCRQRSSSQTSCGSGRALASAFYRPERSADSTCFWALPHPVTDKDRAFFFFYNLYQRLSFRTVMIIYSILIFSHLLFWQMKYCIRPNDLNVLRLK